MSETPARPWLVYAIPGPGLDATLAQAARAGFSHAIVPSAPGLAASPLPLILDVEVTTAATALLPLDPRRPIAAPSPDPAAIAAQCKGVAGLRLTGLGAVATATLDPLLRAVRLACPKAFLLAETQGLSRDAMAALPVGILDGVTSSFPWWDGQAPWFWDEAGLLRSKAPLYVAPEPLGDSFAALTPSLARARLAAAAFIGDGWIVPEPHLAAALALAPELRPGTTASLLGPGPVLALARTDRPDLRRAHHVQLLLANLDPQSPHKIPLRTLHTTLGLSRDALPLPHHLPPGELTLATASLIPAPIPTLPPTPATTAATAPRITIENPTPSIERGRYPAKRLTGDEVTVEADILCDGHDKLGVMLCWQSPGSAAWHETAMHPLGNDRWTASFPLSRPGLHHYQIRAWRDAYATFRDELTKKHAAGLPLTLELQEGVLVVEAATARAKSGLRTQLRQLLRAPVRRNPGLLRDTLLAPETAALMQAVDDRPFMATLDRPIPVRAERRGAAFASWYEVFPRSLSDDETRHGTFADVERHLPRIAAMGFDVLYFPPIHPIGTTNRKGRNNALLAEASDPGSPYAIGSADGGHDALHPELGTLADFEHLRAAAADHGIELAIDFAIQCSPDHPWLREHPDWFTRRPDGTIRFAENPPKKYEDIVNVDFYGEGAVPALWEALCAAVMTWAERGVRLFRVDNPHTKPFPFWEWLIATVQARFPDALFLAEAFTRPKIMYELAKIGFSQSYTYFTWREHRQEFQEYLTELIETAPRDFFRPHFFVNTPDINPVYLQANSRAAHLTRAALAATLSGLWGVYNGFELCEATPLPGREEYLDSEKYQLRAWDWSRPGNIVPEITALNRMRRQNPALQNHLGLTFLPAGNDQVLFFEKATPERDNVVLVAISLSPETTQSTGIELPFWRFGLPPGAPLALDDLTTQTHARWPGGWRDLTLTPALPYAIWRASPAP